MLLGSKTMGRGHEQEMWKYCKSLLLKLQTPENTQLFQCYQYFIFKKPQFFHLSQQLMFKGVKSFDFCFWKLAKKVQLKSYWLYEDDSSLFCRCSSEKWEALKPHSSQQYHSTLFQWKVWLRPRSGTPSNMLQNKSYMTKSVHHVNAGALE